VVVYTIRAANSLPYGISQVLVTDHVPTGLVLVEATVSHGEVTLRPTDTPTPTSPSPTVETWNNLVIANIGEMAVRDTAVVIIKAMVEDNVMPGTVIQNRASFIYAESVAAQAMASLTIGGARPMGTPAAETPAIAVVPAAETLTIVVTPTVTTTAEPPGDLPVTGFGLPIAGLLFALLILVVRRLRPKPVDEI
jgi:uncharacterized repeat protein (TIGR01451 family)